MTGNNSCIRVYADINQINGCKKALAKVEPTIKRISRVLNLAGNEVRFKILYLLHKETEMCVCDLSDVLNMNVSAISQHLRKLKDANVVYDKKIGQTIFYLLENHNLITLLPLFKQIENNRNSKTIKSKV